MSRRSALTRWRDLTVDDTRLTWRGNLAAYVLARLMDTDTLQCWASDKTISERAGVSERTVKRGIEELELLGVLRVTRGKHVGRASYYTGQLAPVKGVHQSPSKGVHQSPSKGVHQSPSASERVSVVPVEGVCGTPQRSERGAATAGAPYADAPCAPPSASLEDAPYRPHYDTLAEWWAAVDKWFCGVGHGDTALGIDGLLIDCSDDPHSFDDPTWNLEENRSRATSIVITAIEWVCSGRPPIPTITSPRDVREMLHGFIREMRGEREAVLA